MDDAAPKPTVTIKKYANRRLYNTATSSYVTLDHLGAMVKEGVEFNVYDAKTGEDITRSVLTQIIVEEEGTGVDKTCCRSASCTSIRSVSMATICNGWCRNTSSTACSLCRRTRNSSAQFVPDRLLAASFRSAARLRKWASRTWRCSSARCACSRRSAPMGRQGGSHR